MVDYPAAHSMDTDWFAVDAEGNLGIFSSSEGGAVPYTANEMYIGEFIDEFIENLPTDSRGIIYLPTDGKIAAEGANLESLWEEIRFDDTTINSGRTTERDKHLYETFYEMLLVLASEDVIEELMPDVRWRFAGTDVVVFVEKCSNEKVRILIESGKILRGKTWFDPFENAYLLGLFAYYCNWQIPMPYKLLGKPIYPAKFDSLPSELQQKIKPVRFDSLRFSESKEIQPIEHMPCRTWRGADLWFDTKRERPEWQGIDEEEEDIE